MKPPPPNCKARFTRRDGNDACFGRPRQDEVWGWVCDACGLNVDVQRPRTRGPTAAPPDPDQIPLLAAPSPAPVPACAEVPDVPHR